MVDYKVNVVVDPTNATKGSSDVEKGLRRAESAASDLEKAFKRAADAYLSFEGGKKFLEAAEGAEQVEDRLRILVSSEEQLAELTDKIREISKEGGVSSLVTADSYQRLALASQELGKTQEELLNFQKNLEISVRATGRSFGESEQAIKAVAYAMATGEVQGRALRTIFNDLPTVAAALSDKLGVTNSGLKELGDQGKISAEDLFEALSHVTKQTADLAAQNNKLGSAGNELNESFIQFTDKINKNLGALAGEESAVKALAKAFDGLSSAMDDPIMKMDQVQRSLEEVATLPQVSTGAILVNTERELAALEARAVKTPTVLAQIELLKRRLDELGDRAIGVSKDIEKAKATGQDALGPIPGAGGTSGGGAAATEKATSAQVDSKAKLDAADIRRIGIMEQVNLKAQEQLDIGKAALTGDRDQILADQLIAAQQDKNLKKREELTQADKDAALAKAHLINLQKDEIAARQEVLGPLEDYQHKIQGLQALEGDEPQLHDKIQQALEKDQIAYLQTSNTMEAGFGRAFLKLKSEAEDFASVAEKAVNVFADDATKALTDFVTEGKGTFNDFRDAVLKDLEQILIRWLVVQAITGILGGPGAAAVAGATSGAVAGHASGGTEQPGLPYLVGEHGPEIHTPGVTGSTAPIGGGAPPTVNVHISNVTDPNEMASQLASGKYDQHIVNAISRKKDTVRQVVR